MDSSSEQKRFNAADELAFDLPFSEVFDRQVLWPVSAPASSDLIVHASVMQEQGCGAGLENLPGAGAEDLPKAAVAIGSHDDHPSAKGLRQPQDGFRRGAGLAITQTDACASAARCRRRRAQA